jgi:hypothetical protein
MLRLAHPAREGQGTDPPTRRKGRKPASLSLTRDEVRRVRIALRNTARAYGGFDVLAQVMGVTTRNLYRANSPTSNPSGTFAIRLARAAGVAVEGMLDGTLNDAGRCRWCRTKLGDGRIAGGAP